MVVFPKKLLNFIYQSLKGNWSKIAKKCTETLNTLADKGQNFKVSHVSLDKLAVYDALETSTVTWTKDKKSIFNFHLASSAYTVYVKRTYYFTFYLYNV